MKLIHLTIEDRRNVSRRLAVVIKRGVKKSEVAHELDMPWQLVHNVAGGRVPSPLTCMVLGPWLAKKEAELGISTP